MSYERWKQVDDYIDGLFVGPDEVLDETLRASDAARLPPIAVAPNQGKFLYLLAKLFGARSILEIGTLGAYSTIWLARALPPDGRLVTLEYEPAHADVARENIANAGLQEWVEIRVGDAHETLAQLAEEKAGPFDLVFIDADKESYPEYFAWSLDLSRVGTLIVADNVIRDGAVADPSSDDPRVTSVKRFNEIVAREPRVEATILQTVGVKGHDGFAVALVVG